MPSFETIAEKIAGLILALAAMLSPIVTLWLGSKQAKNQAKRGQADDLLDISNAAKIQGETWEEIVKNLREEIKRIKIDAEARLTELKALRQQLQDNQTQLDSVMANEMKSKELEQKVILLTDENMQLRAQIVTVEGDNLRLQTELNETRDEVQKLRVENDNLRKTIGEIQRDVRGIKRQTGELQMRNKGDRDA